MTDKRFAAQVEHHLAGLLTSREIAQLSKLLESSAEARRLYLLAVEVHLDLGTALHATAPLAEREDGKETNAMARISLNCSCGWNFFIPGTTTGLDTRCPSCGQQVRIPGRKPGQDVSKSPGEIAAEAQGRQSLIRNAVLAAAVLVIAGGIGFWVVQKPPPEPTTEPGKVVKPQELPGSVVGNSGKVGGKTPGGSIPENPGPKINSKVVSSSELIEQHKRGVDANIWLINMAGLISECLRFRNLTAEWIQFQKEMAVYDGNIKNHLKEAKTLGQPLAIQQYLLPGDQIFGFAQRDFTNMKYRDAANFIQQWVSNWGPGSTPDQLDFARNNERLSIYVDFPQETQQLRALTKHPTLGLEGSPDEALVAVQVAVPPDLINDINDRFDALPPGYRGMVATMDRKKFEALTQKQKAPSDDIEWLKIHILGEAIVSFQRDADHIRAKVVELEPKLKENVASDVIYLKDSRKIEGQIIEETDEYAKIKARYGSIKIPKTEIQRVEKGKGAALEFPAKFAEAMRPEKAAAKLEKLLPLLAWCAEKNLSLQKEYVAYVILTQDAAHEGARKIANVPKPK
jgi:hypothetical protein